MSGISPTVPDAPDSNLLATGYAFLGWDDNTVIGWDDSIQIGIDASTEEGDIYPTAPSGSGSINPS